MHAGAETVSEFFNEFSHAAHSSMERIVFMSPLPPSKRLETLLTSRHYVARCVYLQGSAFEDADLLRAGVSQVRGGGFNHFGRRVEERTIVLLEAQIESFAAYWASWLAIDRFRLC